MPEERQPFDRWEKIVADAIERIEDYPDGTITPEEAKHFIKSGDRGVLSRQGSAAIRFCPAPSYTHPSNRRRDQNTAAFGD